MPTNIDELQIEIEATSSDAAAKIDQLAASLSNLRSVARGGAGLTTATRQLNRLKSAIDGIGDSSSHLNALSRAISSMRGSAGSASSALSSVARAARSTRVDYSSLSSEVQSVASRFSSLPSSMQASANAIARVRDALDNLSGTKVSVPVESAEKSIKELNSAISQAISSAGRLNSSLLSGDSVAAQIGNAYASLPPQIRRVISANSALASSNQRVSNSYGVLGTGISRAQIRFGAMLVITRQLASVMSNWVKESNDYVENLNLFTVAMGEYAEEAQSYAEEVQAAMGIDASDWMRNQGVFMQMASGFGVVAEDAALMSQNLTQLGYDISSFYNISIEDAMQKLQSGLAGEIEPLRRLGYAIDEASLSQVALNHGITQSVSSMTQAEKSQLRYIAIMEQSTNAMGDMARTIQTPANAMRILDQQITQLSRALGNMLIPILQQIIPWVQAFVVVLTEAAQAIAMLFGFELPTIDYSGLDGVSAGASDVEESLDGATGAAKELQRELLGIDELNIIEPNNTSGGGASAGGSLGDLGLELPTYDFLDGLEERTNQITDFLRSIADEVAAIGAGFAAWKIASSVLKWFDDLKSGRFNKIDKIAAGIGLMVTGFTLEWQGAYDIGYNGPTVQNVLKTLIGSALGIAGSLLVFGTGPLGWTIGITTALVIAIAGITMGYNQRQLENELAERFGEIELTVEEAKELAERIMSSPLSIQLDAYVAASSNAEQAVQDYLESANSLQDLVWRVRVGLEVEESDIESSVDAMIANAQSVLSSYREVYTLTIGVSFSDVNIQSDMATFVNEYFNQSESDLIELGSELKQTILDAMADGIIDEKEMKTIQDLQSEVNQMMAAVADAEYRAQLTNAVFDLDGELSFESVKAVADELGTIAQNQLDTLEQTHLDALALIELKYQTDGNYEEYVSALQDEMRTYFANQASVSGTAFQPLIDKINAAFSDVLADSEDVFARPVSELLSRTFHQFETDETGVLVEGTINDFMRSVHDQWSSGILALNLDDTTEAAIAEAVEAMKPTAQQLQEVAQACREAGISVPESIAEGLSDYYQLSAIEGNMDAINYLLGEKLSTDPNFIQALETAKDAGVEINGAIAEGLLNNIEIVNNADGTVSIINDTIGEKVLEITPELKETFRLLGVDITSSLEESATSGVKDAMFTVSKTITSESTVLKSTAYNAGSSIGSNLSAGVVAGVNGALAGIRQAASNVVNTAKNTMASQAMIKSPSRLFRDEIGLNIGLGVAEGITGAVSAVEDASSSLVSSSMSDMKLVTDAIAKSMQEVNEKVSGGSYTIASEQYTIANIPEIGKMFRQPYEYKNSDYYNPDESNEEIVSAILAAAQQVTAAVEESGGDVYMDGDVVGRRVTEWQNRQNRIYGRPVQRI